jgi:predicted nucleic acid-binding protein
MSDTEPKILRGFMLDTNVFNHLVSGHIRLADLPMNSTLVVTHIQKDEIEQWPPKTKAEAATKAKVLAMLHIVDVVVPTASMVLGFSRVGGARLGDGGLLGKIRNHLMKKFPKRREANTRDALIGETSIRLSLELITGDEALRDIVNELGGRAHSIARSDRS